MTDESMLERGAGLVLHGLLGSMIGSKTGEIFAGVIVNLLSSGLEAAGLKTWNMIRRDRGNNNLEKLAKASLDAGIKKLFTLKSPGNRTLFWKGSQKNAMKAAKTYFDAEIDKCSDMAQHLFSSLLLGDAEQVSAAVNRLLNPPLQASEVTDWEAMAVWLSADFLMEFANLYEQPEYEKGRLAFQRDLMWATITLFTYSSHEQQKLAEEQRKFFQLASEQLEKIARDQVQLPAWSSAFGSLEKSIDTMSEIRARISDQQLKRPYLYIPSESLSDVKGLQRFDFAALATAIHGREKEIESIDSFMQPDEKTATDFKWWVWTGPSGNGKSRLADYACTVAAANGFDSGFLATDTIDSIDEWSLSSPLFLVIDNAASCSAAIRRLLLWAANLARGGRLSAVIRILLLERSANRSLDSWLDMVLGSRLQELEFSRYYFPARTGRIVPHEIGNLNADAIWETMTDIWRNLQYSPPDRKLVMDAFREAKIPNRPLFAIFAATAVAESESISRIRLWDPETLSSMFLSDEAKRWADAGLSPQGMNLLTLATICRNRTRSLWDCVQSNKDLFPAYDDSSMSLTVGGDELHNADGLCAVSPDILGELFVRERLLGHLGFGSHYAVSRDAKAVVRIAVQKFPEQSIRFLLSLLTTLPGKESHRAVLHAISELKIPARKNAPQEVITAIHKLAHIYELLNRHDDAMATFDRVLKFANKKDRMAALYCRGRFCYNNGRYAKAILDFTEFGNSTESEIERRAAAFYHAGKSHQELHDNESAVQCFRSAMRKRGSGWWYRCRAAADAHELLTASGDNSAASEYRNWLLQRSEESDAEAAANALLALARVASRNHSNEDAIRFAEEGLKTTTPGVRIGLIYWRGKAQFELGHLENALQDFESVIREAPESDVEFASWASFYKGEVLSNLGQRSGACSIWQKLIQSDSVSSNVKAWAQLRVIRSLREVGDLRDAIDAASHEIQLRPVDWDVHLALVTEQAHLARESGQSSKAEMLYRELLQAPASDTEKAWALFYQGDSLKALNKTEEAEHCWQQLTESTESSPDARGWAYLRLAESCLERKEFDRALAFVQSGLAISSADLKPLLINQQAHCYRKAGNFEQAVEKYDEVLQSSSNVTRRAWALFFQGDSLRALRRVDEAEARWHEGAKHSTSAEIRGWCWSRLADLWYEQHRDNDVISLEAMEIDDADMPSVVRRYILYDVANAHLRRSDHKRASDTFRMLLAISPSQNGDFWGCWSRIRRSHCLIALGEDEAAKIELQFVLAESETEKYRKAAQDRLNEMSDLQNRELRKPPNTQTEA